MPGVVLVQTCMEADYTAATGTCAVPFWNPQERGFPTMTLEGAALISGAIALLWGIAYVFKMLRKALNEIG